MTFPVESQQKSICTKTGSPVLLFLVDMYLCFVLATFVLELCFILANELTSFARYLSMASPQMVIISDLACNMCHTSSTPKSKDGRDALPGAVECLEELRSKGKRLVILSNTSKREIFTMARLPKFGFRQELFDGGVTSGEVGTHDGFDNSRLLMC